MAFIITTTSSLPGGILVIPEFGDRTYNHPVVSYDLESEFDIDEIRTSFTIQNAIDNGWITVVDSTGNPINNLGDLQISAEEVLASVVQYTPSTLGDWDTFIPSLTSDSLDQLASRIKFIEVNGTGNNGTVTSITTGTNLTGGTITTSGTISLSTTLTGLTSVTSTSFVGALTGNASTATSLQTARTINGTSFNGTANITVTANTTNTLTIGSNLAGTSFNGSAPVTISLATTLTGLTSVTSTTFVGALTGNASTATTLQQARTINGVSFNGSASITVTAAAGTLTGTTLNATVVSSSLTSVGTISTGVWNGTAIGDTYISSSTNWNIAYTNRITSLTTTGSSGAATLISNTLNIPTYTLSGLGGQAALSGTGIVVSTAGTISYVTDNSSNWNTAFTQRLQWDGGSTNLVAATGRTSLGATTVGSNLFTATNPSAITFIRVNADNSVSLLNAASFRTAIGAASTLQEAYTASTTPEILIDGTRGALSVRSSSTSTTLEILQNQTIVNDPNIGTNIPAAYIEAPTTGAPDGIRTYFNSGTASSSGYIAYSYDGTAPYIRLVDMDDDPAYIAFSTARIGLTSPGPGTFSAPTIVNTFGSRGATAAATTGFSWKTNGAVSGAALVEIMSLDSNFLKIPSRTTANRPTPSNGMIGYDSTTNKFEAYENGAWVNIIPNTPATYQASPANPTTTTSTTGVMMGLAGTITPAKSGTVMIIISGDYDNAKGDNGCAVQIRTGTGTAPANGAALTGTARGGLVTMNVIASNGTTTNRTPFTCNCLITSLTVGTAVWIDISLAAVVGGTARARNISISAIEI
jgi:hypothetical protein